MSKAYNDTIQDSVRSGGKDTLADKPTYFLNLEALKEPTSTPSEASYAMWTEEHSVQSRARRENRENRQRGHQVAEVADFDLQSHLQGSEAPAKSKWKFW